MTSSVSSIALAFENAGVVNPIKAAKLAIADANANAAPKAVKPKAARKPKAKAKAPKENANAAKEGRAMTANAIAKAANAKAAGKVFSVPAAKKAALAKARSALLNASLAEAAAIKLAGGRKADYAKRMSACYGDNWHKVTVGDATTDTEKAIALLVDQEKNLMRAKAKEAKLANVNKPWFDARDAQEKANADAALIAAGIDPALRSKRDTKSMEKRQLEQCSTLYKAHMAEGAITSDRSLEANAHIGRALIALGIDLTTFNLKG